MDWTKIKTKHFLYNKHWTDRMTAGFVRLLCLTAHLERLPDEDEMKQVIGQKSLESVSKVLQKSDTSLSKVLQKVLEDVSKVYRNREQNRCRQTTYRENNALRKNVNNATDKRRVDNIYIGDIDIKKSSKAKFIKPSLQEIKDYIQEIGASVSAEAFHNKHEANGWKVGKNPMKDWRATVRYWNSLVNKDKPKKDDDLWNKPHPMTLKK